MFDRRYLYLFFIVSSFFCSEMYACFSICRAPVFFNVIKRMVKRDFSKSTFIYKECFQKKNDLLYEEVKTMKEEVVTLKKQILILKEKEISLESEDDPYLVFEKKINRHLAIYDKMDKIFRKLGLFIK